MMRTGSGWILVLVLASLSVKVAGFTSLSLVSSSSTPTWFGSYRPNQPLYLIDVSMIDPNMVDVTIAVVSAAAGAASQLPRIQELEKEVQEARQSLTSAEKDMEEKIKELEDKLFLMDEEFERQTDKVRKQYDTRMWEEVARMTDKIKTDYQYKLEIKVEEEKARLLQDQLLLINQGTKRGELAELRLRQGQIEDTNFQLEQALKDSQLELEKIRSLSNNNKRGWWPF